MKSPFNTSLNLGESITMVNAYARALQTASANGKQNETMYEIAIKIMSECQHILEATRSENQPELTLQDIINRTQSNA